MELIILIFHFQLKILANNPKFCFTVLASAHWKSNLIQYLFLIKIFILLDMKCYQSRQSQKLFDVYIAPYR